MADYPDFTIIALLKGIYLGQPKALAVDSVGNMIAMLKAQYGGEPINVEADIAGNIQINMVAQGLSEIINRFKYGAPDYVTDTVTVDELETVELFETISKGQVYASVINVVRTIDPADKFIITIDDEILSDVTIETLFDYRAMAGLNLPAAILRYSLSPAYVVALAAPGYTFETNFKVEYYHGAAGVPGNVDVTYHIYYTTI